MKINELQDRIAQLRDELATTEAAIPPVEAQLAPAEEALAAAQEEHDTIGALWARSQAAAGIGWSPTVEGSTWREKTVEETERTRSALRDSEHAFGIVRDRLQAQLVAVNRLRGQRSDLGMRARYLEGLIQSTEAELSRERLAQERAARGREDLLTRLRGQLGV